MSHYFSSEPPARSREREVRVVLRGRPMTAGTAAGVFSGGRLDPGTAVLLREVPDPPASGLGVDLGCGWGPIALAMADAAPGLRVVGIDVNPAARALTEANAHRNGLAVEARAPEEFAGPAPIDVLWSNPPIRVGKAVLHEMMRTWLPRLAPAGEAYLVVNKNLGSDSLHRWLEQELPVTVARVASHKGFRVLRVRPART
ncbi:class I SAM-dependent methyltransferase [Pseudactinotalea sp. HY158]|uniref:class I SAM-dependent methyltransferase n=1 Tax=Pseudactinotalea sp. HY158 TaxID=2654547 RepID=UPI001E418AE8|nr:methyltransferase [Pseudactinotalea sp. HY158]